MKRSLSLALGPDTALVLAGTCLVAGTYGLVRLAYGLVLPDVQASVSMSSAVAGYVSSGASAAYCAGALVGLVAADRPRLLVVGALATASAGSLGMALAPGTGTLVPAVVLASTGAGLASPGLVAVVARNLRADRVDRAQATVNAGTGPGLVGAGLLALLVPDWRLGFVVSAVLTAAAGLCVLALDRPRRTPAPADPAPARGRLRVLGRPAAAAFLLGTASAAVWTYGRAHLVASGTSDPGSVLAWIALGVGGTATVLTAHLLSALPARRAWLLTTAAVAVATAGLAGSGRLPLAVLACAVFGWAFVAATSALIAWTGELLPDRAASGTSALFITLVLGQAAGSSLLGRVAELAGMPVAFLLAAGAAALAAACGTRAPRPLPGRPAAPVAVAGAGPTDALTPRGQGHPGRPRRPARWSRGGT